MLTKALRTVAMIAITAAAGLVPATSSAANHVAGSRIVWTRDRSDTSSGQLVMARPDGSGATALTDPPRGDKDLNAVISPDGTEVVYERDLADGTTQLMIVGSNGTGMRALPLGCVGTCAADLDPSWAHDGRHIYFNRVLGPFDPTTGDAASAVLWESSLDGSHLRRISPAGIDGAFEDSHARVAAGGDYLTFVRLRDSDLSTAVFRMDPDGRAVHQLTPWGIGGDEADVSPATHGATRDLVVFETHGGGSHQDIATVPSTCSSIADCTRKIRYLTHEPPATTAFNPSWSPNGTQIAFTRAHVGSDPPAADIWRMEADGAHQTPVSRSPRFEFRADWGRASGATPR